MPSPPMHCRVSERVTVTIIIPQEPVRGQLEPFYCNSITNIVVVQLPSACWEIFPYFPASSGCRAGQLSAC